MRKTANSCSCRLDSWTRDEREGRIFYHVGSWQYSRAVVVVLTSTSSTSLRFPECGLSPPSVAYIYCLGRIGADNVGGLENFGRGMVPPLLLFEAIRRKHQGTCANGKKFHHLEFGGGRVAYRDEPEGFDKVGISHFLFCCDKEHTAKAVSE